ncbi:hypothetical protein R1flu_028525 [Riccia fluitans]|uniref:Uncharacterized protein n=1 Tax=Riccia fluitans TaxID=41844 RepID=A0ABD1XLX3_9MARC
MDEELTFMEHEIQVNELVDTEDEDHEVKSRGIPREEITLSTKVKFHQTSKKNLLDNYCHELEMSSDESTLEQQSPFKFKSLSRGYTIVSRKVQNLLVAEGEL